MKRLGGITCDRCNKLITEQAITCKSKTGKQLDYCSEQCLLAIKLPITAKQAAQFIWQSNAIEELHFDEAATLFVFMSGNSNIPELDGHVKAFKYLWNLDSNRTLLDFSILEKLHKKLMKNLLPNHFLGLRTCQVRVGWHECPLPSEIRPMLKKWFGKVNSFKNPTEEEIWQSHLAFEHIHPFADGNGRSGRLLWLWLRFKHGYNYKCIFNITKKVDYYPQFDSFNWEDWVE